MKKPQLKAQLSTEFVIISAALLIIFLVVFTAVAKRDIGSVPGLFSARDIADTVASAIDQAAIGTDGSTLVVSLPDSLANGDNYTVILYPEAHQAVILWDTNHYAAYFTTSDVTGAINSTSFAMINDKGAVRIE